MAVGVQGSRGKIIKDATAVNGDVRAGKVFYNNEGREVGEAMIAPNIGRGTHKMSIEECYEWLKIVYPDIKMHTITGQEPLEYMSESVGDVLLIKNNRMHVMGSNNGYYQTFDRILRNIVVLLGFRLSDGYFYPFIHGADKTGEYDEVNYLLVGPSYPSSQDAYFLLNDGGRTSGSPNPNRNELGFHSTRSQGITIFYLSEDIL